MVVQMIFSESKVIFEAEGVVGRFMHKSEKSEFVKLEIQPQKKLKKHLVDFAATFFVVSGEGLFLSQNDSQTIKKDSVFTCEANTERGFENTGSELLEILVVKY
jgi:mannose-6-phosphate isomerase-like protein (cupin superfamily)